MIQNQIGNDLTQEFQSKEGTNEMVTKNGYVAFKSVDAVAKFHANPYYANWSYTFVDGEHRFFPPKNNDLIKGNEPIELYDARKMPLSNDPKKRQIQEKVIKGEKLSIVEKIGGRDHPVKKLYGYDFKPNHVYRAITKEAFENYKTKGFIVGFGDNDEFIVGENNLGVDWYLGGVDPKYGNGEIILECPADKRYFTPTIDNGCSMTLDPTIRHMKSSGSKKPVPMTMVQVIQKPVLQQEVSFESKSDQSTVLENFKILEINNSQRKL